ncbi:MAG: ribosome biogenesis GTP-binding protein YihA/YsxC [Lachnospiraceae bacterium]|nr:ribosome biogenesis GTP-binding protein YihA/YsxC [Lachnospiraceae bacterium]
MPDDKSSVNNKIREAVLETVCGVTSTLPAHEIPEVAFAGKSNVGKSSLINTLLMRKALARTSSQPGKTQTINYFRVNSGETRPDFAPDTYLVDLPGYGFATASPEVKAAWGKMIERYLEKSGALRTVFLLVDMRHPPSANDRQMYDWIVRRGMKSVIIATKKDKIKPSQADRCLKEIRNGLGLRKGDRIIPFSSVTREGRDEVWDEIREAGLI